MNERERGLFLVKKMFQRQTSGKHADCHDVSLLEDDREKLETNSALFFTLIYLVYFFHPPQTRERERDMNIRHRKTDVYIT